MMKRIACVCAVLLAFGTVRASAAEVSTLTGKKYIGDVLSVRDGVLTIRTSGGPVGIAVKELYSVTFGTTVEAQKPETRLDELELVDGSLIQLTSYVVRGKQLEATCVTVPMVTQPKLAIPLETIFHLCRNANDPKSKAEWRILLANRGKRDLLVVRQSEGLSPLPGTILGGSPNGDAIEFEREDSQKQTFKLTRISGGLVFNQPARNVIPPTLCKITDRFGNVLLTQSIDITKTGVLVKTVAGVTIEYAASTLAFVKWDFSQGNITYLSDLEPKVAAATPAPGEPLLSFVKDRSPEGEALKLQGVSYAKGLWLYPDVTLSYTLNQDYRELKLIAGLDDSVPVANAIVKLTLRTDGKTIFAESFARKDAPRALNFDMKGVKELQVSLEGTGLFLGQQLNLVEAKLQK